MYLNRIWIHRLGPIKDFALNLPTGENGLYKPIIFVGGNGSGKTNILSLIADALFESAANHFQDVVPRYEGQARPWFRVVGATTTSVGAKGSFSVLEFADGDDRPAYFQKGGIIDVEMIATLPMEYRGLFPTAEDSNTKSVAIQNHKIREIFENAVHVYFPSNRSEVPDWLNVNSITEGDFDLEIKYSGRMTKPIYVDRGLEPLKQWLLTLLLDSRIDLVEMTSNLGDSPEQKAAELNRGLAISKFHHTSLDLFNSILRIILDDPDVTIRWLGRHNAARLSVFKSNQPLIPSLSSLSTGQATLLNIFGTILRYSDNRPGISPKGICIIDEIDAHMHIDLQYRALPKLLKLFPEIQFIVSSHSPLFALGMAKEFGGDGALILDLPSGTPIAAEAYSEFKKALEAIQDTVAFNEAVIESIKGSGPFVVLLEGETDPQYFQAAARVLGLDELSKMVEFRWIGAIDDNGQGFHTGKSALDQTRSLIKSKPDLVSRKVLLLYDNDAKKTDEDGQDYWVRTLPTNTGNTTVSKGIENLLPESVFGPEMFDTTEKSQGNGTKTVITSLNKMRLCESLCGVTASTGNFVNFEPVFLMIKSLIDREEGRASPAENSTGANG
jgi:predicted ATPase